jgi:PAS domain S-box-containing protein/putative nucleotidyltransferase with HDIG domain
VRGKQAGAITGKLDERYRALFERSLDAVYVHDLAGNFLDANPAALKLLGYSAEEIPDLNFASLLSEDQLPLAMNTLKELIETGTQQNLTEFKLRRKDGGYVYIETKASVIYHNDKAIAAQGIARDITQRRHLEEALKISNKMHRLLADNMEDTVWLMDMNLKTLYTSPSSEKLRGYTVQELMELPLEKHLATDSLKAALDAFKEEMDTLTKDPGYNFKRTLELEFLRKDGSTFWTENKFTLIRDETGRPAAILGEGRDITAQKKAEDELKKSYYKLEKAMKGAIQTIAMIAEVRDPYTAGHQQRVARLAAAIALEMGMPDDKVNSIRIAGILHDIGKISVPSDLLSKPGRLGGIEMQIIQGHPATGREILKSIDFPWPVCSMIMQHHERLDGTGYPDGLVGEQITPEARIIAVADVVEAMSSYRPYRPALGIESALEEIDKYRGKKYDAAVVDVCLRLFREKGFSFE